MTVEGAEGLSTVLGAGTLVSSLGAESVLSADPGALPRHVGYGCEPLARVAPGTAA